MADRDIDALELLWTRKADSEGSYAIAIALLQVAQEINRLRRTLGGKLDAIAEMMPSG